MAFSSLNSLNATKTASGMGGTQRSNQAAFNPAAAQPLQGSPMGMGGQPQAPIPAVGSSYTQGAGMQAGLAPSKANPINNYLGTANGNGVVAGVPGPMANVGQQAPMMTDAEMQDPDNAAMAGYAFAATQDPQASASTNPTPQNPQYRPPAGPGASTGISANPNAQASAGMNSSPVPNRPQPTNPIAAALNRPIERLA